MIPHASPNLSGRESEYVDEVLASTWVGPEGPFVERLEDMVARAAGRGWAVATTTGTSALESAAVVLGLNGAMPVQRLAFPAMRNVLTNLGCDIIEVEGGENHDTAFYGALCDRAPAIGEPPTGASLECYSFAANKVVTCGHGGVVVGDDIILESAVRSVIKQGYGRSGIFNSRMANVNAAIGCAQMERLDEFKATKRRIWERYRDSGIDLMDRGASRWLCTLNGTHDGLVEKMKMKGIECRTEPCGVSLPCSTHLSELDQDRVIAAYWSLQVGGPTQLP